jgi:hypothetical protein
MTVFNPAGIAQEADRHDDDVADRLAPSQGAMPVCTPHMPRRGPDRTLLLTFLLAASVCAMGILAIDAISLEGLSLY